ncbi:MAG: hypothetical protein PHP74_00645 [Candidatus Gracilibacteria bacterium]|nr:hypothetical protein [Candidatus Gracilibacteria bacterium]
MQKKYLVPAVLIVGLMALSSVSVFASTYDSQKPRGEGNFAGLTQEERTEKMEEMKALHEEMQKVVLAGDYESWAKLVEKMPGGSERMEVITKDNFPKFVEAHKLMNSADAIFTDLGIEKGRMGQGGPGMGKMGEKRGGGKGCPMNEVNQE